MGYYDYCPDGDAHRGGLVLYRDGSSRALDPTWGRR